MTASEFDINRVSPLAVLGARAVVPCLTAAYEASPNCKRELGFVGAVHAVVV